MISMMITAVALVYGGVIDKRRREIPDIVPILLLFAGFLDISSCLRIMCLLLPAVLLLTAARLTHSPIPGGDFKLLCTLGFAAGLPTLAAVLLLTGLLVLGYSAVRRVPLKRSVPLCAYVAPAYLLLLILQHFIWR